MTLVFTSTMALRCGRCVSPIVNKLRDFGLCTPRAHISLPYLGPRASCCLRETRKIQAPDERVFEGIRSSGPSFAETAK